jgi:hypothetical protein
VAGVSVDEYLSQTMKVNDKQIRKVIKEELARGIPDYAFVRPVENAVDLLVNDLIKCLVAHINQTSRDPQARNARYAAANRIAAALRRDREFTKVIEDKLKEKLLIFFDEV